MVIVLLETIRKVLNWIITTALVFGLLVGFLFLLGTKIDHRLILNLSWASFLVAVVFPFVRYPIKDWIDDTFFPKAFRQMKKLRALSRQILSPINRDELLNKLFTELSDMGFDSIVLLLKDPCGPTFRVKRSIGLDNSNYELGLDSSLIEILRKEKATIQRSVVGRLRLPDKTQSNLLTEMQRMEADVCFPLFSTRSVKALFGVVCLGKSKLGSSAYSARNIFWLETLMDNLSLMMDKLFFQEFALDVSRYMGRSWAEEMHSNEEGFVQKRCSKRQPLTICMIDIRHFTKMCARMDPREVVELLKEFRTRVSGLVYSNKGTIDKFIGDAIMVLFNSPLLPVDQPERRAIECSMEILKCVGEISAERTRVGLSRISVGIGISSGVVIAGNVDSGDRLEYTVIGDAANFVARLEDLADENQILVSDETYSQVKENVEVKALGPQKFKGIEKPVLVFEIKAIKNAMKKENSDAGSQDVAMNQ